MRNTIQRQVVLNTVKKLKIHPTADDVFQEIQKEHPSISKSTVYRNLHQLVENKEIRLISLPDSPERFDGGSVQHYHFTCKTCSEIFDIHIDYLSGIDNTVQNTYGFQVEDHDITFKGVCSKCQAKIN